MPLHWTIDDSLIVEADAERTERDILDYATSIAKKAHHADVFVDTIPVGDNRYRVVIYYSSNHV